MLIVFAGFLAIAGHAATLDVIGVTLLRTVTTNLNGAGVRVGQAEAYSDTNTFDFEVNPGATGQPTNLFTYVIGPNTANTFTNSLGVESNHADNVARGFYGLTGGVATNVLAVRNYEANSFINYYINASHSIPDRVVNQSFTYGSYDTNVDQIFDDYAARRNVLFVNGAGFNGQPVYSPATCYNGIGVGVANNAGSPFGPTPDGRSKPDITAPGDPDTVTSYATSWVSGGATVLMQAALRGDGGSDTNSAADIRTIKALLLNGAVKPADWTNSPSTPLHFRYGAGVMNVFNSYEQLAGGKHAYISSTTVSTGSAHPPDDMTGAADVLSGWDFNTNSSSILNDSISHYYFNVTNDLPSAIFTATATLVWNRQRNQTGINNLDLFLYDCASSNLVACSTSRVDNVEHIFISRLPPGRYDLQVWKAGGDFVSAAEPYALAWSFVSTPLAISNAGANIVLTWPIYPAGLVLASATNLVSPNWNTNGLPAPVVTNNQNVVSLNGKNATQFFRLRQP